MYQWGLGKPWNNLFCTIKKIKCWPSVADLLVIYIYANVTHVLYSLTVSVYFMGTLISSLYVLWRALLEDSSVLCVRIVQWSTIPCMYTKTGSTSLYHKHWATTNCQYTLDWDQVRNRGAVNWARVSSIWSWSSFLPSGPFLVYWHFSLFRT